MIRILLCLYRIDKQLLASCLDSIRSQTYKDWSLIIVWDDDEVMDTTIDFDGMDVRVCNDSEHIGISRARNKGLALCEKDDIVTYIDHDNIWYPDYLQAVVTAFQDDTVMTTYADMRYKDVETVVSTEFDWNALMRKNFIDLNVFAHRASLVQTLGGFDPCLSRMVDWDLILRYTRHHPPRHLPVIGVEYNNDGGRSRISLCHPATINVYRIWMKWSRLRPLLAGYKILYVVHHYCQLSETYIDWEMEYFVRLGAIIEIYADHPQPAAPVPHTKRVYSDLSEALRLFRPDHIHVHWMNIALIHQHRLRESGVPMTVRVHGFEWDGQMAIYLLRTIPNLRHIFVYRSSMVLERRMIAIPVGMNPRLHYPDIIPRHDRRSVLRVVAGLPNKDIEFFLELADRLADEFEFTLCIIHANTRETYTDEIARRKTRCRVLVDVPREDVPALMRASGIYLHTNNDPKIGQPISIVEAMACGCYVLVRDHPSFLQIVRDAGKGYASMDDAIRQLRETTTWTDREWDRARCQSIDHAYTYFIPERTFELVARAIRHGSISE